MNCKVKAMMPISETILNMAEEIINDKDVFVVRVKEKGNSSFVVYVDGKNAVTIEKCAFWNRQLRKNIMENMEVFKEGTFNLEISSFGVGSPLVDTRQYAINEGRKVVVEYRSIHTTTKLEGVLSNVKEDTIQICTQDKKKDTVNTVPIKHIEKIYIEAIF